MCLSLVNLCLDTIVDHFPRYNLEFQTTNDERTKRKYEFLRRRYSYEVLKKLCIKRESLKDFIDLLVNEHIKIIDITWFKDCSWEKVTSKVAEIGHNVEKVVFPDDPRLFRTKIPWKDLMCCFPNLKFFTFHTNCNNLILRNVAKFCANIEEIDVENSYLVTTDAVKYLCKNENGIDLCTKLRRLYIKNTFIGDDGVKILLKALPSLEIIDHYDLPLLLYSMHKSDLSSLDKVKPYNIRKLDVSPFCKKVLKICLSVCPRITCLSCRLHNEPEFNFFSNFPSHLENLQIAAGEVFRININDFLTDKCKKLTFLSVENCTLSVSILAESCPYLKELTLRAVDLYSDDDSKLTFNSLCSIKFCNYGKDDNPDKAISLLLSSSTNLESLSFHCCDNFTTEIKTNIMKCCVKNSIKKIFFYFSEIEKEFIKDLLLNCSTLDYLDIESCFGRIDGYELLNFTRNYSLKAKVEIRYPTIESYLNFDFDFDFRFDTDFEFMDFENCVITE